MKDIRQYIKFSLKDYEDFDNYINYKIFQM